MIDITDESYESDLTEEESVALLLSSEHAIAPPLSPAAQAVLDAYWTDKGFIMAEDINKSIAAALRALVGANAYEVEGGGWYSLVIDVDDIYAIADELEKQ